MEEHREERERERERERMQEEGSQSDHQEPEEEDEREKTKPSKRIQEEGSQSDHQEPEEEDEREKTKPSKRIQEEAKQLKLERTKRWQQPSDLEENVSQSNIQADEEPTNCLVLKNVFDPDPSLKEGSKYYMRIRDNIHQKCGQYGAVHHIHTDENLGFVYMKFDTTRSATLAQEALHEKPYKERVITANFVGTNKYDSMFGTWKK